MAEKVRLDILLAERGMAPSREVARRMIMAGEVRVDGQVRDKPGLRVARRPFQLMFGGACAPMLGRVQADSRIAYSKMGQHVFMPLM